MYRISEIVYARNRSRSKSSLDFVFAAKNEVYLEKINNLLYLNDEIHGMLSRDNLYSLMADTLLVISMSHIWML